MMDVKHQRHIGHFEHFNLSFSAYAVLKLTTFHKGYDLSWIDGV